MGRGASRTGQSSNDTDVRKEVASITDANLPQLREEFAYTLNERSSNVFARARLNHETRYCVWPGQSEDGRKWTPKLGEDEVFPWNGASDSRPNLVDCMIKKHVAFLMTLWKKQRTVVSATQINDEAWANRMTSFLRWMKYTQMTEARGENELLANYLLERGLGMMGVFWDKRTQLGYEELDLEGLVQLCFNQMQQPDGDQSFADLPKMIFDPTMDPESVPLLGALFPDVPSGRLDKVINDLRQKQFAKFPRPIVMVNRPRLMALSPNDDVFISPDCMNPNLEDANVHWVEVMREAKFRARAKDFGWDEQWTEEMLETQRGNVEFGSMQFNQRIYLGTSNLLPRRGDLDSRKLFLVVHSFRRLADKEGVPGIYYTVWNPNINRADDKADLVASHDLLNYSHGQMPFVLLQSERRSRKPDDARGYGEIANTWQSQIKAEWDNRVDRASIMTLPPSFYPQGQQPDKWGPGVQVPTNSPTGYGFYDVKGDPQGSKEVEESVRQFADEYFGFAVDPENQVDSQIMRQFLGDNFMDGQRQIDTQVLKLCQQFMPDDIYFRVVGSAKGQPIHTKIEDIQGEFDLAISFDAGDMDPDQRAQKLQFLQQAIGMDHNGLIDQTEAMTVAFEMIDPNLGERVLKPAEAASQQEVEDELNTAVKLLVGMKIPVKPGQAYQMRLQVLQQFLQTNQSAQQAYKTNPQAQEAIQQRLKDLQFQVDQQQNAVIGRGGPEFAPKMLTH